MNERRVVITGIGCISPLGNDLTTTWEGLKAGRSGIAKITQLDPEPFDCKIAGEVKNFEPDGYFRVPKDARRADRYVQFAVAASKMAMAGLRHGRLRDRSPPLRRDGRQRHRRPGHAWSANTRST